MREFLAAIFIVFFLGFVLDGVRSALPQTSQDLMMLQIPHAGKHPGETHTDYYDQGCCNGHDCEPIPTTAVTEEKDGYHVRYISNTQSIGYVEGVIPYGQERISNGCVEGMCMHACAYRSMKTAKNCSASQAGAGGCQEFDFSKPATLRCLYVTSVF